MHAYTHVPYACLDEALEALRLTRPREQTGGYAERLGNESRLLFLAAVRTRV